ncbi:hypothetical protein L873DRAFT_1004087 [Choiromyces venosus 120613-1]|uniref:Uncharacterized protein n=1 Tax=Choiromyces venosus 120613-1 TaxID=1336337 RepID=A0A3N4JKD8_9PEZI|nr:hypothetical protein L873DRAFT_1004087 [Choiromyces venosus 120613-1]
MIRARWLKRARRDEVGWIRCGGRCMGGEVFGGGGGGGERGREKEGSRWQWKATNSFRQPFSSFSLFSTVGQLVCTRSGKKLWNSYFRLTSQIYPCLLRLMGSFPCTYG